MNSEYIHQIALCLGQLRAVKGCDPGQALRKTVGDP